MSKRTRAHKQPPHLARQAGAAREADSSDAARDRGGEAFNAGHFGEAIRLWERAARHHPEVISALAEAYFRRALVPTTPPDQQLRDLERATALAPNEPRYHYHLGLAYHRRGERDPALTAYQIAYDANAQTRGLAFAFALAKLETDANADVNALVGLSESEREVIDMLAQLLREDTSFLRAADSRPWFKSLLAKMSSANPTLALWRGLGYLLEGDDTTAQSILAGANQLTPHGEALRHYYLGVLAARRGDWSGAQVAWEQARARGLATPWLRGNLATLHLKHARAALRAENWKLAAEEARAVQPGLPAPQANPVDAGAGAIAAVALDRLAHGAVRAGNWAQAAAHWSEARGLARAPRAVLQNLAIASEISGAWEQAADAWRAVLQMKPRSKKAQDPSAPSAGQAPFEDAQWTWTRKRATLDLQKAGRLDEAITLMKQRVKANPKDLTGRMELVDALLANQQETAARNELQRVLQIDPGYREARSKLAEWYAAREEWYAAESEMRHVLERAPTDESARKQMAFLMRQRGRALHADGKVAAAREVFEHALTYAPNDVETHVDLGRTALDLKQPDVARHDFEQAYHWGAKQIGTHEQIVNCWVIARNKAEMKRAIARAEAELVQPSPLFYVHIGMTCLQIAASHREWEKLGKELVDKGVAFQPNDVELLRHVVTDFADAQSRYGLPYGERLTKLTPDDPLAWLMLGMFQLVSGKLDDARSSMKQAARLARRQGLADVELAANEMRRTLDDPMLSMAASLGLPLDAVFSILPHAEEFEDENEDADAEFFAFGAPRRKRRRR